MKFAILSLLLFTSLNASAELCTPDETYQKALSYIKRSHSKADEIYLQRNDVRKVKNGEYVTDANGNYVIEKVDVSYAYTGSNGDIVVGTHWVSAYNCHTSGTGSGQSGPGRKFSEEFEAP
ncbi:hypothetical protein [Pseudobdellovibrio exovorus]|uniref:Uncharacterized protein n=1 Tax=Pseudobdellovibrio exovorus JSS TaxID=1184267 RepID=M4V7L6_9BACT|nr:hypothetical protein [Pseudobdellovibrio exovorus]AGH94430.1 hypothetical protein A11Q_210 [Pseudobdellovibrio exovorus JSS]